MRTSRTQVKYLCEEGHTLIGLQMRDCLINFSWSGIEPKCTNITGIVNCSNTSPDLNFISVFLIKLDPILKLNFFSLL